MSDCAKSGKHFRSNSYNPTNMYIHFTDHIKPKCNEIEIDLNRDIYFIEIKGIRYFPEKRSIYHENDLSWMNG